MAARRPLRRRSPSRTSPKLLRRQGFVSSPVKGEGGHLKPLLERLEHILVERLLEGHYHRGKLLGIGPFPGAEFRVLRLDVHILVAAGRSEEHTSELQSLMRISYAVFCLKKKKKNRQ